LIPQHVPDEKKKEISCVSRQRTYFFLTEISQIKDWLNENQKK